MHRIDPDIVGAVLHRGGLGQGAHRALGGVVADMNAVLAGDPGDRGDVDDRPAALRLHVRDREFHAEKDAARVDRHQPVPGGGVEQILDRAAGQPGIVDENVEPAISGSVASIAARHCPSSATSSRWKIAAPLLRVISATTALPSSSSRSATTTLAPSRAKIRAILAPMPEAAPVISATLLSSRIDDPPSDGSIGRRGHAASRLPVGEPRTPNGGP